LEDAVRSNFGRKGEAIVNANIDALRAGRAVADKM
jgi:Pyruvate/2-oxoacid:ferredoxin oxidoreductase gamma subunit